MTESSTDHGRLIVGEKMELFAEAVRLAVAQHAACNGRDFTWAFTGGSTPQVWYQWAAENRAIPAGMLATTHFTVSDERCVPLSSDESNFGNADRKLLAPLAVPVEQRHPWPRPDEPAQSVLAYREAMRLLQGPGRAYDLCFLGMGDDAHTASFFPGSPLLAEDGGEYFVATETVQKGWRLTVTPTGLAHCGLIVVMALGAGKAPALRRVMQGEEAVADVPAKILRTCADKTVWLVDSAAAAELKI
jgi:6-phosphogluconolactonase